MRISGLSGGLGPGCLGFLGTVAGGARWQAPKPDLHSILRANFPPTPDAPPMPSTDTRESRGKQKRGLGRGLGGGSDGGGLKSRQRKLELPSPSWSCYSPIDLPFRCSMTGSAWPTNPCYMRPGGSREGTVQVGGPGPTGGVALKPTSE